MFTGLIEETGEITRIDAGDDALRLTVAGPVVTSDASHGDSISVDGVCLTVVAQDATADGRGTFTADVMRQTLQMSTLGELGPGARVNLERAARADSRLGGHIVQGHVDGTAELVSITPGEAWRVLRFALDDDLAPLVVSKGSITLSGVSLTVSDVSDPAARAPEAWFEVSLIPETLAATTLGTLEPGDRVNVETDIVARHLLRVRAYLAAEQPTPGTAAADAPPGHAPGTPTTGPTPAA